MPAASISPEATMVIRDISPSITTLSVPFDFAGGRVKAGGRATIFRLASGNLAVMSPVALTAPVRTKLATMGTIGYIIALNMGHHLHISAWAEAFPKAKVIGVDGLPEKRENDPATKGTNFSHVFTTNNKNTGIADDFDKEFSYEYIDGLPNKDVVFLHKPTKTLVQADILFNLPASEQYEKVPSGVKTGVLGRWVASAYSAQGSMVWQKRALWYGAGSKGRQSVADSMKRVLDWDFERIIPCHGDVIETDAKSRLAQVTEWFINGKK
ncbi:hypothetical protein O988_00342 [Pseudogymnoascus sp. VKM F-3808]|nr:hypothetical protein O988_00342 [Pseudogymnoascus sp. VKM F-3808]